MNLIKRKIFKRIRNVVLAILTFLVVVFVGTVIYFRLSMITDIKVENGQVTYDNEFIKRKKADLRKVEINHKSEIEQIKDIDFIYNGKNISYTNKIYEKDQRYYLPLEETLNSMGVEFSKKENVYNISNVRLSLTDANFLMNETLYALRGEALNIEGITYISLNDIEHILGLRDAWNHEERKINLFEEKKEIKEGNRSNKSGKAAMIRLEDMSAGNRYITSEGIESVKVMADYLYSEGAKFNIAWISRFKSPENKIDNDLLVNKNIENVQFINMLDHLLFRGASIGLHGYTHQAGVYESAVGSDLSAKFNSSEEETRKIVESAITTAKVLNIPISFFESAHYHSTKAQQKIVEEYFDACFEPYKYYWNLNPVISKRNDSTIYVPTPLSYTKAVDGSDMAEKIRKNANKNKLTALYLHPSKEISSVKFKEIDENGYVDYEYDTNSPLHNIFKALNETGQVTISINDLK